MSEITKNEKALLKVIWKRNKVRYGLSVLWMIAVIVLEQLYLYPYMAGRFGNLVAVMIYILLILIVPYQLKVFQYFFDRSYEGQITAIEQHIPENILVNKSISDMMRNARYNSIGITSVQTESKVELWITSNQKKIKKTIMIDESCGAVPYREYDYIRYFKGTNYPMIVKRNKPHSDDGIVCVWCLETKKNQNTDICQTCGMPLMIPSDETKAEH